MHSPLTTTDLAGVIYTSGKVFDGLKTGRLDTENFLRTGNTEGVSSRADLSLLEDLRDAANLILTANENITGSFVRRINAQLSRSAALHPGQLRTADQNIGVVTRYGRHTPPAVDHQTLDNLIAQATGSADTTDNALRLFVAIAKAQPFEDGNKRTALFAANALLLRAGTGTLLTVPYDEDNPQVAERFNDLLAHAYINDEPEQVIAMLRTAGIKQIGGRHDTSPATRNPKPNVRETDAWDSTDPGLQTGSRGPTL